MDNSDDIDEKLREREIKRLTTPLNFSKGILRLFKWFPTDIEGNSILPTINVWWGINMKYILEPKIGILTEGEILKYAGESKTASRIRLKRGIGSFSDKTTLYGNKISLIWVFIGLPSIILGIFLLIFSTFVNEVVRLFAILPLFIIGIVTIYTSYVFYLKNYTKSELKKQNIFAKEDNLESELFNPNFSKNTSSLKIYKKQINELEKLYQSKEKIARELIEKHFSPPQLTYDRFMGVIDSCSTLFYNQTESTLDIIKIATDNTPKLDEKLKKRVDILKSLVKKIDELASELAINLSDSTEQSSDEVKDLLEDMQKLADSVKEYA